MLALLVDLCVAIRFLVMALCTLAAIFVPFFSEWIGLVGAAGFLPLTFVFPTGVFGNHSEKGANRTEMGGAG